MTARARADALRVGGLQPFTTIDFPGALAAVVFVQGCPWRCPSCHNPHLREPSAPDAAAAPTWASLRPWLERRAGRLDALVFSGGEPTLDPALPAAMQEARALGYRIGLHTAGMSPRRLQALLPLVDWVGLDIKAPLDDDALHDRLSGVRGAAADVQASLRLLQASGVAYECRTTTDPLLLAGDALERLVQDLAARGAAPHVLQPCRGAPQGSSPGETHDGPHGARDGARLAGSGAPVAWPDAAALSALRARYPGLVTRHAA